MVNDLKFWIYTKLISFHLRKVGKYNERKKELAKKMREAISEKKKSGFDSATGEFLGSPIGFWLAGIFFVVISLAIYHSVSAWFVCVFLVALVFSLLVVKIYSLWQKRK